MEFYVRIVDTYNYGQLIGTKTCKILTDEVKEEEEIKINWDNLSEIYNTYGLLCKFNIWNERKGRRISFFLDEVFPITNAKRDIKEWKTKELSLSLKISYKKIDVSLNEVLNWWDSEKAIQYLKEKGLEIK